jgi:uncharacterized protein (TIRG00374 family)
MKRWQFWTGIFLGLACIAYVVSTIKDPAEFGRALSAVKVIWLAPIIVSYFAVMGLRAWRWQFILHHAGKAGYLNVLAAIFVCYMGNNIFPLRAGELMRVFLIGKREPTISYSGALATVVVERLFDFLIVLLSLAGILMVIPFPEGGLPVTIGEASYDLVTAMRGLGQGAFLASLCLFVVLILLNARPEWALSPLQRVLGLVTTWYDKCPPDSTLRRLLRDRPAAWGEAALSALRRFSSGLQVMGRPWSLFLLLFLSILIWVVNLAPVWLSARAFPEIASLDLMGCAFLLVVGAAAASIPGPPGFFGIFHAFNQLALLFYVNDLAGKNISPDTALSFAIILHAGYYFPLIVAGLAAVWAQGYSLSRLKEQAEQSGTSLPEKLP